MKIIAYTALHYGKTYLDAAIHSVIDAVSEYHVLYSASPSHGSISGRPCPDSENDLHAIAWQAAGTKLRWHIGDWRQENEQRNNIYHYVPDADAIFIVDSDEIYPDGLVYDLLGQTHTWQQRYIRVPFVHYYRNFWHCVIHDPAYPVRLVYPQIQEGTATAQVRSIAHMGYCQPAETIRYKLGIHGHTGQFRCTPDAYVDTIYLDHNRWTDLHPIGSEWWNTEVIHPLDYLPNWMQAHPNFDKEWVE